MSSTSYLSLLLIALLATACSDVKNTRYTDTTELETPPVMKIVERPKSQLKEKEKNTGLGDVVSLSHSAKQPVIKIKKIFERSWNIVEQGLSLSKIEVTDKNRDKGVFFLKFDPDQQASKEPGLLDSMTFFLFEDDYYEEAAYKLTVIWRESDTEVSVELINQENDDFLVDEGDFDSSVDSGAKLIKLLYKTIREDLPID